MSMHTQNTIPSYLDTKQKYRVRKHWTAYLLADVFEKGEGGQFLISVLLGRPIHQNNGEFSAAWSRRQRSLSADPRRTMVPISRYAAMGAASGVSPIRFSHSARNNARSGATQASERRQRDGRGDDTPPITFGRRLTQRKAALSSSYAPP